MTDHKCVLVLDPSLPPGVLANTAAILALSVGAQHPQWIGHVLADRDDEPHLGISTRAIPVLQAPADRLRSLREAARPHEPALLVVDLIDATRQTRSYAEYAAAMADIRADALRYHGLALAGTQKLIRQLTGALGLLRGEG
jgi:hypothetical protein